MNKLNPVIKELLTELVGDFIQPSLHDFPFSSLGNIREALSYLADEIESIDPQEIFENLTNEVEESELEMEEV